MSRNLRSELFAAAPRHVLLVVSLQHFSGGLRSLRGDLAELGRSFEAFSQDYRDDRGDDLALIARFVAAIAGSAARTQRGSHE